MTVPPPFPGGQPNHPNQPPVQGGQQPYPGPQFGQPQGSPYGAGPYQGQQFGGYQPPPQKQGMSTGLKVFLGLLFVVFLFIGGCSVFAVVAVNRAGDAIVDTFEDSALVESNTIIAECDGNTSTAVVEFTSPFPDSKSFVSVDVDFVQDGVVVGTGTASFDHVSPGETHRATVSPVEVIEPIGDTSCELSGGFAF